MLSIYNIWTIARFEIKTLSRSWFLRIFSALAFIILFFFNVSVFTNLFEGFTPRLMYGMNSSLPYSNLLLFNAVQAVITVFLASDFLKRDKKLDTTEAIYIRSMTNSDYVLGKSLGVFVIFVSLNILLLIMCAAINATAHSTLFSSAAYLFYPLFISLPTLIFIIGLSFLTMTLIRNQAVTFILLLGYISVTLFYLGPKFYSLFDYTGFFVPMLYSDFIGFGEIKDLILQRGMYILLGLSFICMTMFLFRRLPQSVPMRKLSLILSIALFVAGLFIGYMYVTKYTGGQTLRADMIELNKKYAGKPAGYIVNNDISVVHNGNSIRCSSGVTLKNTSDNLISEFIFSLNPGLRITNLSSGGNQIEFKRELHIVHISDLILKPGDQIELKFEYSGSIDDEACYLDIIENKRHELKNIAMYVSQKLYSMVTPDYVLLTSENLWYPVAGVTYNPDAQFESNINFTNYRISVETTPGLTVLSQGKVTEEQEGNFLFEPEAPLTRISLIIGPYEMRSIDVDSVSYSLYTLKNHTYFDEYMNEIGDTLSSIIREVKRDYEREINLSYAFSRFSIVETPIQFTEYKRLWTAAFESTQPEMTFLPENAVSLEAADFKFSNMRRERWGNRENQVILPRELQSNQLKRFVNSTFLDGPESGFFGNDDEGESFSNPYTAFPNYYSFANYVSGPQPLLNTIMEFYLKVEDENTSIYSRLETGMTAYETAVQKFRGESLEQIISDTTNSRYMKDYLKLKTAFLFTSIEKEIGKKLLRDLLRDLLEENRFKNISFDLINESLKSQYGLDLNPLLNKWYGSSELPGYFISGIKNSKIIDNQRERYQVQFNITNPEPVDGYLKVSFNPHRGGEGRRGRRFGGRGGQDEPIDERIVFIDSNCTKKIGVVLDEAPGNMTVNTIISQNLPLRQDITFDEFPENKKAAPFDGEFILDEIVSFTPEGEIIVDNEDENFELFNPEQRSWLKKILNFSDEDEGKYIGIRFWRIPHEWRAAIHTEAYGRFVHSVHFTRAGDGDVKVAWNAGISQSGYYDVYCHTVLPPRQFRRRDIGEEKYQYLIYHDDGTEEVIVEMETAERGWSLLGSFYFSEGNAKVELTNESPGRMIIADAVKWVLRK